MAFMNGCYCLYEYVLWICLMEKEQKDVGAVAHAVALLSFLADAPLPLGVAAIARATGINPSTCFAILRTLARYRFVAFRGADKTYTLGMGIAELATGLVGIRHADLIRPELERLASEYNMLLALWRITADDHIILIDRAHSQTAVRVEMALGQRMPSLIGAVGRCVGATLNLPHDELYSRFTRLRWQVPPSFEAYNADITTARKRGWAIDEGQNFRGLNAVASIISEPNGRPRFGVSGITIAGQHERAWLEKMGDDLYKTTTLISAALFAPLQKPKNKDS